MYTVVENKKKFICPLFFVQLYVQKFLHLVNLGWMKLNFEGREMVEGFQNIFSLL